MRIPALLACLAPLALGACTAHSFATLQHDFERLQSTRAECRSAKGASAADARLCLANFDAPFLDLAQRARDAAADAKDERTRIGLLRLAASAGWESGLPEGLNLVDAVAADGNIRCDRLPKDRFGAPRDCALLQVAPAFASHVRAVRSIEALEPRISKLGPEDQTALEDISTKYVANVWKPVEEARSGRLKQDRELSPSVLNYLDRQRPVMYCTLTHLAFLNKEAGNTARSNTLLSERAEYMLKPFPGLANTICDPALRREE